MRDVKFRAWNKTTGEMNTDISVMFMNNYSDTLNGFVSHYAIKSGLKIMQYAGFKDKNWKDVYEGDIVVAYSAGFKGVFQIKWRQGGSPCFILYPAYQNKEFWHISASKREPGQILIDVECNVSEVKTKETYYIDEHLEVIGNIHENPELLEKIGG